MVNVIESLVAHQLLESMSKPRSVKGIGGWRPPAVMVMVMVMMPAVRHDVGGQLRPTVGSRGLNLQGEVIVNDGIVVRCRV